MHFHYLGLLGIGESTYQSAIDILKTCRFMLLMEYFVVIARKLLQII